jgi:hypothetical protein
MPLERDAFRSKLVAAEVGGVAEFGASAQLAREGGEHEAAAGKIRFSSK